MAASAKQQGNQPPGRLLLHLHGLPQQERQRRRQQQQWEATCSGDSI
jgi:hypothetical protein